MQVCQYWSSSQAGQCSLPDCGSVCCPKYADTHVSTLPTADCTCCQGVHTPHAVAAAGRHCLAEPQQVLDAALAPAVGRRQHGRWRRGSVTQLPTFLLAGSIHIQPTMQLGITSKISMQSEKSISKHIGIEPWASIFVSNILAIALYQHAVKTPGGSGLRQKAVTRMILVATLIPLHPPD